MLTKPLSRLGIFSICCFVFIFCAHQSFAGKLGDFEEDATKRKNKVKAEQIESQPENTKGNRSHSCLNFFFEIFFDILLSNDESQKNTLTNSQEDESTYIEASPPPVISVEEPKNSEIIEALEADDPASTDDFFDATPLSFILNANYQRVSSEIDAYDAGLTIFFKTNHDKSIGIYTRLTKYQEDTTPQDTLWIYRLHAGVIGSVLNPRFHLGFGAGGFFINGDRTNCGVSLMMPFNLELHKYFHINLVPTYAQINHNNIFDVDLFYTLGVEPFSLCLGYRWLRSENQSLDSPYCGIQARF